MSDFNENVIREFRENGGKVGGYFEHMPMLLLTTKGAKSGKTRIHPLAYTKDGNRLVIIASKGGAPTNPDWFYNVQAHPEATVEIGSQRFKARAQVPQGEERERLYAQMAAKLPQFAEYQKQTTRQIPVITLEPLDR